MGAKELWEMVDRNYSQVSKARVVQLRYQFHNLCRSSKKIMDYLVKIKIICDSLTAVESSVSDCEQVHHILYVQGPEYGMFCIVLQVLPNCLLSTS